MKVVNQYLGLGKTKYNSNVCFVSNNLTEIFLTERFTRIKNSGSFPEKILLEIRDQINFENIQIGENGDVHRPVFLEDKKNIEFPFYEYLEKKKLSFSVSHLNSEIKFLSHHDAHAYAALGVSPFQESVILVLDGAGNSKHDLGVEKNNFLEFEDCSIYIQKGSELKLIDKEYVSFNQKNIPSKIGLAYEELAKFIFNSGQNAGKVMGLAPLGSNLLESDFINLVASLDWEKAFKGNQKSLWESEKNIYWNDLAFSIQTFFERELFRILNKIRINIPNISNLIITGGCALNCTANAKVLNSKLFNNVFIHPFPGDESIGFGIANALKLNNEPESWTPTHFNVQTSSFGALNSSIIPADLRAIFQEDRFEIIQTRNYIEHAVELLKDNQIIAWFFGRSECGPRSLGHRSLLANPKIPNLKNIFNTQIKNRENFRPYGCSVLAEMAHEYFMVESNFENPFMSFAVKVREKWISELKEVTHVDGTSRMQTVHRSQNNEFYDLISKFGQQTGLYSLLNTSLNVMDEPIVETLVDARNFLIKSKVKYLIIQNHIIKKID